MPEDFLLVIDESHATVPQIGGMFAGDRSRKTVLVNYGFRLPSALDNRPLNFEEFMAMTRQFSLRQRYARRIRAAEQCCRQSSYLANPGDQFRERECRLASGLTGKIENRRSRANSTHSLLASPLVVEQIIRPTGLLDPKITVRAAEKPDR